MNAEDMKTREDFEAALDRLVDYATKFLNDEQIVADLRQFADDYEEECR